MQENWCCPGSPQRFEVTTFVNSIFPDRYTGYFSTKYYNMKNIIAVVFVGLFLLFSATISASAPGKSKVVNIKTSAICGSCKNRIEKALKAVSGVEEAVLNLNSKQVKVKYNPQATSPDALRVAISKVGYHADEVKRDDAAYNQLPECCQRVVPGDKH